MRGGKIDPGKPVALADRLKPWLHALAARHESLPTAGPGPLAGTTIGVKDISDTDDMPTGKGAYRTSPREAREMTVFVYLALICVASFWSLP